MNVERIANRYGLVLKRQKNHRVLADESGRTLVLANTPSDHRWHHNALATLSRLIGVRKSELVGPALPLRALREKTRLEHLEPLEPLEPVEIPVGCGTPRKLTHEERRARRKKNEARQDAERKERNLLRRLEKDMTSAERTQANKARQDAARERFAMERRRYELQECADLANHALADLPDYGARQTTGLALRLVAELKSRGYESEVVLMVEVGTGTDCFSEHGVWSVPVVRCGSQYIDFYTRTIYDQPTWQNQDGDMIEALVSLKDLAKDSALEAKAGG